MSQDPFSPDELGGIARLFPLPNLVLFPHVAQPLHIFEPRYRQLMADALDDDRLITLALLRPGWEEDYHLQPALHEMVCVGRILQEQPLADGRYNLLLQGICRARVLEEVPVKKLYRIARVEMCLDQPLDDGEEERVLRTLLGEAVRPYFSAHPPAVEQLRSLLEGELTLGALADIFSFALPLEVEVKQQLLELCDVQRRVTTLLKDLGNRTPPAPAAPQTPRRRFPPDFSNN